MVSSILVQISDIEWTMRSIHLACAISRNTGSKLVLLSSGMGVDSLSPREYRMVAEDYRVGFTLQPMVYISQVDALVQAAGAVHSSMVFAHLPSQLLPFRDRLQRWNLRRQLASQGCQLYTLETSEQPETRKQVSAKIPKRV